MITDTNSIIEFGVSTLLGATGGNMIFLGILFFLGLGVILIMGKAKASTVVMVGVSFSILFGILVPWAFMWIVWIAILASLFVLINGLRKWITGQ